jgi:hypothetical protein
MAPKEEILVAATDARYAESSIPRSTTLARESPTSPLNTREENDATDSGNQENDVHEFWQQRP